jgi:hypothetical protein
MGHANGAAPCGQKPKKNAPGVNRRASNLLRSSSELIAKLLRRFAADHFNHKPSRILDITICINV